jgi:site-specific recombinase XerD
MTTELIPTTGGAVGAVDPLADFGAFLRLHTAEGDASRATVRSYQGNAARFVDWCRERGTDPATATEGDVIDYRRNLVQADYSRGTVAVKLASIRRLYEALVWRGL